MVGLFLTSSRKYAILKTVLSHLIFDKQANEKIEKVGFDI